MPSIAQWLCIDKLNTFIRVIRFNGGIIGSLKTLVRMDDLKIGELVGTDRFGNKYYQNDVYFHGRNRWVVYSDNVYLDYDGSQIPAEWHGWMHYTTDIPPTKADLVKYKWMVEHSDNLSGTPNQYVPFSTVPPKIESWNPSEPLLPQRDQKQIK